MSDTRTLQTRTMVGTFEVAQPAPVPTAAEIAQQLQNVSSSTGCLLLQEWAEAIRQQALHEAYKQQG